jgi:hypothetical protein
MKRMLLGLTLIATPAAASEPIQVNCGEESAAVCDQDALIARMTRERDLVAGFLSLPTDRPITIFVGDVWRGRPVEVARAWPEWRHIVIPPRILARGIAPTAHEITHVLAGRGASNLLTEGLAVLTHGRFGEQPAFPNFGRPLEQALNLSLGATGPLETAPTLAQVEAWIAGFDDFPRRRLGYLIAGMFCEYLLLERLGGDRAAFLRLYRSGDFAGLAGDAGDVLLARWWAARAS